MDNRKRRYIWGSITIAILVVVMFVSASTGMTSGARNIIGTIINPLQTSVSFVYQKVNSAADFLFGSKEMKEEYQFLKAENARLNEDLALYQEVVSRAEFLENEYNLKKNIDYDYTEAYINGENPNNVFGTYTINVGKNQGVEVGDIAISAVKYTEEIYKEGLVGVVSQVGENWATINSIISDDNSISFINARTLDQGVLNSNGEEGLKGYTFDSDSSVKEGDKLITSGLGGVYPRDLYIGEISSVNKSDEYDSQIIVESEVDFSELYRVFIIDKDGLVNE